MNEPMSDKRFADIGKALEAAEGPSLLHELYAEARRQRSLPAERDQDTRAVARLLAASRTGGVTELAAAGRALADRFTHRIAELHARERNTMTANQSGTVTRTVTKTVPCRVCRRPLTRSTTLEQTIGPSNLGAHGLQKPLQEILADLEAEAEAWEPADDVHPKCLDIETVTRTGSHL